MSVPYVGELRTLAVFRGLLSDPVIAALCEYLDAAQRVGSAAESKYCAFVAALYDSGSPSFADFVRNAVNCSVNPYARAVGEGCAVPAAVLASARRELKILARLSAATPEELTAPLRTDAELPGFDAGEPMSADEYIRRMENIGRYGWGIFAGARVFRLGDGGRAESVPHPDPVRLTDLIGYDREKKLVTDNTLALLAGRSAANALLTGDAGTGKSSLVKAVANEYACEGLRLVQARKEQLFMLPRLLEELGDSPLKFIVFIDDLSFVGEDDNFGALKAILEGGVQSRRSNVVIYATSNRRHLVRESFSDREGDDVHRNDSMQQLFSLSDRFGLRVTFSRPGKADYLAIVRALALRAGADMPESELEAEAERFALAKGSRSGRTARQFVDSVCAKNL